MRKYSSKVRKVSVSQFAIAIVKNRYGMRTYMYRCSKLISIDHEREVDKERPLGVVTRKKNLFFLLQTIVLLYCL